ncbi:hypothetical protein ACIQUQ_13750 [Streptomyces sp. NPDC101118]|uniref:hypothetical protein n=1 Tax=Streptomyces sp. NPDC101118 TaxID=3366109 RepID=UPI0037FD7D84
MTAALRVRRPRVGHLDDRAPALAEGHHRTAVAAHLLAPGRFIRAPAGTGAWAVTAPLADHPRPARLMLRRYEETRARHPYAPGAGRAA